MKTIQSSINVLDRSVKACSKALIANRADIESGVLR